MKKFLLITCFLGVYSIAKAQNCAQELSQAERDYEAGKLIELPEKIIKLFELDEENDCLTHEEEIRAWKLLTKTYIFTDNEIEAESALIGLLKADPEHVVDKQVDPRELSFLMEQFRTDPIFRIALKIGVNSSSVNVIDDLQYSTSPSSPSYNFPKFYNGKTSSGASTYSVDGIPSQFNPNAGIATGITVELSIERHIMKGIEVSLGGQYRQSNYNVDSYIVGPNTYTSLTNRQVYVRTPVLVRYNLWYDEHERHKIKPYVYAGASIDFLLSANYIDASRSGGTAFTLSEANADLTTLKQVNELDYSLFGGAGIKLRIKTHYLTLEARYDNALNNYINPDNRYSNKSSVFDLAFIEDNLSLNNLSLTLGWAHSIYSPKKLKEN